MPAEKKRASPLKIINLFGDRGRCAGLVNRAPGREIHFWKYYFDDYLALDPDGGCHYIDREKLEATAREISGGGYDAAACDSSDALLLRFFSWKKGLPHIPFIINEVDMFEMAGWVRRFLIKNYKEDPFPDFIRDRSNHWMHIIGSRRDFYLGLGIPESNLYFLPMCTASIEFMFPGFYNGAAGGRSEFAGKIISAGSHNRDYETLAAAAGKAGVEVHIITDMKARGAVETPGVAWHDSLPEDEYVRALRDARAVVVPLLKSNRAAGQMACAVPMKFGTPTIAAAGDSTADLVINWETGLTYEPGSADSLAEALEFAAGNSGGMAEISVRAAARERELSRIASENLALLVRNLRKK